jgi:nitroreductase
MPILSNPVIDAMATCRAMRFLKSEPISDDVLETVLFAATRASSPNNTQAWTFVVVRDEGQRRAIGAAIEPLARQLNINAPPDQTARRTLGGAANLAENLAMAPVIVFVCVRNVYPPKRPIESMMWSAGHAASQNLIVAARSLGLGSVFTMLQHVNEPAIREIIGLPEGVHIATTIPLGWPERAFGPVTRRPLEDVVRYDRFSP